MSKEIIVSVIVPVYNAGRYLRRCVDSILAQTYTKIEVILVDDGSKDESGDIAEAYASADSRVRTFHKKNGGASSARNLGILEARGEWIVFVDSDDYVGEHYVEELVCCMESGDLVIQGLTKVADDRVVDRLEFDEWICPRNEIKVLLNSKTFFDRGFPVAKAFDRRIIERHAISFKENIHYSEDLIFMLEYIRYVSKIRFIKGSNYFYQVNVSTLSQRYNSFESEYGLYEEFDSLTKKIARELGTEQSDTAKGLSALMLMRSVYAMYVNNEYEKQERLLKVRKLRTEHKLFIKNYYAPKITLLKLAKRLLLLSSMMFHVFCLFKFSKK